MKSLTERKRKRERETNTNIRDKNLTNHWFGEPFRYTAMLFSRYSLIDRENKHVAEVASQRANKPDKNDLK